MKKTILFLTLILSGFVFTKSWVGINSNSPQDARKELINQDSYSNTIHFELDGFWFKKADNNSEDIFIIDVNEGTPLLEKGSPDLEKLVTSIIIPENASMNFEIVDSKYKEYSDVSLAPSKGTLFRNIDPNSVPLEYNEVYTQNEFFPGKLAELSNPYILRDFHGQTLIVYPFQYNPISKVLRVYSELTVKVFSDSNIYNQSLLRNSNENYSISSEFSHMYKSHFINYDSQQSRYDVLEEHGNMLVISNDAFMSDMESFVEWKNIKGIPTEIVPLSAIGNSSSAINQYVTDYYYQSGLTFLLLVGDISQVPSISVSGTASDPSYGYIEGNDYYPEIMVGRFSAENSTHVQTQVERVINYERYPSSQAGAYRYGIGIASSEGSGIGDEGESDYQHLDNIRQKLMDYTYIDLDQIYATNGGSISDVNSAVNEGRSIINYTGHGSNTSWGTTGFSNSNVDALTNTEVWPFIQSVACVNGAFDQGTCFAEAWLRATHNGQPSGAIAMVASTVNQQWAPPMEAQDEFNDILIEAYADNIKRTYGGLFYNSTMLMVDSYGSNGQSEASYWHLFGDPSFIVRTDDPQHLTVQHGQTILIGQSEFVVDVGINGANVTLSSNGNLIQSAYSNNGIAVLNIEDLALTPGVWNLNIFGYNHYNYESDINVIAPEGPYIISGGYEISMESNSNGMVENGEQISLNLSAENVGVENAYSVVASITSDDEYVIFENTELNFGNIEAGQTAYNNDMISFSTKHSTPDGHVIHFEINFNSQNNLTWESGINVLVNAPDMELSGASFDDDSGDGIWDAGENAMISVILSNNGNASNYSYPGAILESSNPYIEIISNTEYLYGIEAGQSVELQFTVMALEDAPLATTVAFSATFGELNCEVDCITINPYDFSMIIGHPTILIWDPVGGISGNRFVEFLESTGRTGYDYVSGNLTSTDYYTTAFIFLGIFYAPSNHQLTQSEADGFVQMLNNGGSVYMEGGDTWAYDSQTSLHGMFGLNGVSDGSSDLGTINGVAGTFTEGMAFTYNGGNDWIDQLAPSGGFTILENNSPNYSTAIAYVNEDVGYKTIGASHELGGLQGDDVDNYFEKILNFFETGEGGSIECSAGDLNEDGMNDILDIVAQVNILVQISVPTDYQLCAADINSDGEINVLDIVLNINIIVGGNHSSKGRNYKFASYANLVKSDGNVLLNTDGNIKGLQLNVDSNSIILNNEIDMEIAYNEVSGDLVFYSINPNRFLNGEIKLFSYLDEDIDIQDVLAVNSANNIVNSDIVKALSPSVFNLNQNYPNPFNPSTSISFDIGTANEVELLIYDINGREVKSLFSGFLNSGQHSFIWNGKNNADSKVSSGTYIYRLRSENNIVSKKMIFMK